AAAVDGGEARADGDRELVGPVAAEQAADVRERGDDGGLRGDVARRYAAGIGRAGAVPLRGGHCGGVNVQLVAAVPPVDLVEGRDGAGVVQREAGGQGEDVLAAAALEVSEAGEGVVRRVAGVELPDVEGEPVAVILGESVRRTDGAPLGIGVA